MKKRFKIVVKSFLDPDYHHVLSGEPMSFDKAEKVERGLLMTMDMDRFYASTIEIEDENE